LAALEALVCEQEGQLAAIHKIAMEQDGILRKQDDVLRRMDNALANLFACAMESYGRSAMDDDDD